MSVVVRPAEVNDLESVAELMIEMDEFYAEVDRESTETKVANMRRFLFGASPSAYLLVAHDEDDSTVLGIAAYSFLWPAVGTTRSLYLKELYVLRSRSRGQIGSSLMHALHATAHKEGCTRVEWTTDKGNIHAQRFYAAIGSVTDDSKLFYRSTDLDAAGPTIT